MGTRQRRQREAQQRRHSILDAARELFWQQGYFKTTMPQIAARAELAPGTLYLYFPAKSSLYAALLEEGYEMLQQRLEEQLDSGLSPAQLAEAMIDVFIRFATETPEYFDIIFFVFQREGAGWEGNLEQAQIQRLKAREATCRQLVGRALQAAGPAADDADRSSSVNALWSMLAGVIFFFKNEPDFAEVAAQAKRLLLKAVFENTGQHGAEQE